MASDILLDNEIRRFGLSSSEVRVFNFLLRNGKSEISEISRKLKIASTNVYPIVKALMNRGIVESTFTRPVKFHAVPLSKALDVLIMQHKNLLSREVESLEEIKENINAKWQEIKVEEEKAEAKRFQILKEGSVYSKLLMSLDKMSKNIYLFMSRRNFVKLYKTDFLDKLAERLEKGEIRAAFLLDESLRNIDVERANVEVKFVKGACTNDFLIFDDEELFYYLDKPTTKEENTVLWTTLPSFATIFKNMFEAILKTQLKEEPQEIEASASNSKKVMILVMVSEQASEDHEELREIQELVSHHLSDLKSWRLERSVILPK